MTNSVEPIVFYELFRDPTPFLQLTIESFGLNPVHLLAIFIAFLPRQLQGREDVTTQHFCATIKPDGVVIASAPNIYVRSSTLHASRHSISLSTCNICAIVADLSGLGWQIIFFGQKATVQP